MWYLWAALRNYSPVILLPVAAVIGVIGYNVEGLISDKYTPYKPSIAEQREERLLEELPKQAKEHGSLADKKFVPKTIFEKNLSPQLKE